jgi:hypothetical protein
MILEERPEDRFGFRSLQMAAFDDADDYLLMQEAFEEEVVGVEDDCLAVYYVAPRFARRSRLRH